MLSWPAGTWIVGAAGLVLIGVGLWNGYRGIEKKFLKNWMTEKMSATAQSWGSRAGVIGLLARMVVFALIGILVVKAAHVLVRSTVEFAWSRSPAPRLEPTLRREPPRRIAVVASHSGVSWHRASTVALMSELICRGLCVRAPVRAPAKHPPRDTDAAVVIVLASDRAGDVRAVLEPLTLIARLVK